MRAEGRAVVVGQGVRPPGAQGVVQDVGGTHRQPQTGIETAGGERGHRTGRIAHQEPVRAADPAQQAADGDRSAALLDVVGAVGGQTGRRGAEPLQGAAHAVGKPVGVAGHADVGMPPVVDDPRQVSGSERGVEHAVERRGFVAARDPEHLLGTDQQVAVAVQAEVAGDPRAGSVRADDEPRPHLPRPVPAGQEEGAVATAVVAGAQRDPHPRVGRGPGRGHVERRHVAHPVLVAITDQRHRAAQPRRVEHHPPDRRPEAVGRQREVVERLPDEDPRGADRAGQRGPPLDQQHVVAALGEQRGGVQPGQAGPDDQHVDDLRARTGSRRAAGGAGHRFASFRSSRSQPRRRAPPAQASRAVTDDASVILGTSPSRRNAAPDPGRTDASADIHS